MKMKSLQTLASLLLLLALPVGIACSPEPPLELRVYVSKIHQVDDVFRFFGRWSRRPETIEKSVRVADFEFYTSEAGLLRAQREGDRKVKEFDSFHAASSQGYMPPTLEGLDAGVRGFAGGGGRIWLGTNGVGILSYDPVKDLWSRYDVKQESIPGWQATVLYADDHYVFAEAASFEDQPGSGLCIFSIESETWFELKTLPVQLVVSGRDSDEESVPAVASEVGLKDGATYVLRTNDSNGSETRIEIPAALLAQAL